MYTMREQVTKKRVRVCLCVRIYLCDVYSFMYALHI